MTVKVSPKYQVVIPEEVRRHLDIKPGMKVDVIAKGGVAFLVPLGKLQDLQQSLSGKISTLNIRDKNDRDL